LKLPQFNIGRRCILASRGNNRRSSSFRLSFHFRQSACARSARASDPRASDVRVPGSVDGRNLDVSKSPRLPRAAEPQRIFQPCRRAELGSTREARAASSHLLSAAAVWDGMIIDKSDADFKGRSPTQCHGNNCHDCWLYPTFSSRLVDYAIARCSGGMPS
jgi:hypothetical protein